jgi:hypothetical protein
MGENRIPRGHSIAQSPLQLKQDGAARDRACKPMSPPHPLTCHSRESGNPGHSSSHADDPMDPRFRGGDGPTSGLVIPAESGNPGRASIRADHPMDRRFRGGDEVSSDLVIPAESGSAECASSRADDTMDPAQACAGAGLSRGACPHRRGGDAISRALGLVRECLVRDPSCLTGE